MAVFPTSRHTAPPKNKHPVAGNGVFIAGRQASGRLTEADQLPRVENRLCSRLPRETQTGVMEGASTRSPEDSTK